MPSPPRRLPSRPSTSEIAFGKAIDSRRRAWLSSASRSIRAQFVLEHLAILTRVTSARTALDVAGLAQLAIQQNPNAWVDVLQDLYRRVSLDFARRSFTRVLAGKGKAAVPGDPVDLVAAVTRSYLAQTAGAKIVGITAETLRLLRVTLDRGMSLGETPVQMVARIDALYLAQIIPNRSRVIARTEVITASNIGNRAGAKATKLNLTKRWLATLGDQRTREEHSAAHGQERPMDEYYVVAGQTLLFPGDGAHGASAFNLINCRCTETYRKAGTRRQERRNRAPQSAKWKQSVDAAHRSGSQFVSNLSTWAVANGLSVTAYQAAVAASMAVVLAVAAIYFRMRPFALLLTLRRLVFASQGPQLVVTTGARVAFEEALWELPLAAAEFDPSARPLYGYLGEQPGGGLGVKNQLLDQYGRVAVRLKDEIRDRVTVTIGDSFDLTNGGTLPRVNPDPLVEPTHRLDPFGADDPLKIVSVDDLFVTDAGYAEAQIHGGLRVTDIDYVYFDAQPDDALRKALKRLGIRWSIA